LRNLWRLAAAAGLLLSFGLRPGYAADLPDPWVELDADGVLALRVVVPAGAKCPAALADGVAVAMQPRTSADSRFSIVVCEGHAPPASARLTVDDIAVPSLAPQIQRIAVIGDTGCRLKGRVVQDCNDPLSWPFSTVARRAAARKPDLVIHVGDYHYRESACPAGRPGCAGTPFGDNWPVWKLDFFDPAAPLLAAAPWVFARGNHEDCHRAASGWFRLLDPHPAMPAACPDLTEPFALRLGGLTLLMFDSAAADDDAVQPASLPAYSGALSRLLAGAPPQSWIVTHRPFWALNQGLGIPFSRTVNATEQAASRGQPLAAVDLVLSGHVHDFASYGFGPERPAQLVVGDGGDLTDALLQPVVPGRVIDGMPIVKGFGLQRFGYFIFERAEDGWSGTLFGLDDAVLAQCRLRGRDLDCGQ